MSKVSYPKMALEGGEEFVKPTKRYGDPFTKGEKIYLCSACNRVWHYELCYQRKRFSYLEDWFPKLQPEKICPECQNGF